MGILRKIFVLSVPFWLLGCKFNPLDYYVDRTIKVKLRDRTQIGNTMRFEKKVTFKLYDSWLEPVYRCDQIVCGTEYEYNCDTYYIDGKAEEICGFDEVPKLCDTNCRFEDEYRKKFIGRFKSPLEVEFVGLNSPDDIKKLRHLFIGEGTNYNYRHYLNDPSERPKIDQRLLKNLKPEFHTLLVLDAFGYKLVDEQDFMDIPETFKPGDKIVLRVEVEKSESEKRQYSVIGSTEDFPAKKQWQKD